MNLSAKSDISSNLMNETTEAECLQAFIDGYEAMTKVPSLCQQGPSVADIFDFPQVCFMVL
jgi:hypothetical protein